MSRTDKDRAKFGTPRCDYDERWKWPSPSWWKRWTRQQERERARQDIRNGREPQPDYGKTKEYWW